MNEKNIICRVDDVLGEKYYYTKHESGLEIYIFPKKMTSKVALLGVGFGSLYEIGANDGENTLEFSSGIAHYLEHKLFTNEGDLDAAEELAALGADANAYTSNNKTVYMFSCTDNFCASLASLVGFVTHPYFTDENVESERGIIKQEINMCLDSPYDAVAQNLLVALYGDCKISTDVLGTVDSVSQISADMLYECYDSFYRCSNMTLVASGDIDPGEVIRVIDTALPNKMPRSVPRLPDVCYDSAVHMPYTERIMPVSSPIFEIGIKDAHPSADVRERAKRDVAMTILDDIIFSQTGALYNELFEGGYINESYSYGYSITRDVAFHSVYAEGDDPLAVLDKIKTRISEMKREGISDRDFIRSKRVLLADHIREFDSVDEIANSLLSFAMDGIDSFEYHRIIDSVSKADVERCLNDSFDEECFAISVIKNS